MNDSIITKARGALRLAREGATAGERAAAQAALDRILEKYDFCIADLESPDLEWYQFAYTTPFEKRLLFQLHGKVTERRDDKYLDGDGYIEVLLTPDEWEEMTRVVDAHVAAWRALVDDVFRAFVFVNGLYHDKGGESPKQPFDKALKTALWSRNISPTVIPVAMSRRIL